jgi:polysaccharide biosynthesis/export protein
MISDSKASGSKMTFFNKLVVTFVLLSGFACAQTCDGPDCQTQSPQIDTHSDSDVTKAAIGLPGGVDVRPNRSSENLSNSIRGRQARMAQESAVPEKGGRVAPEPDTEFQHYVSQSLGKRLSMYGYNLFSEPPSTFAPVDHIPVTADYVLGPGDEIVVHAWGQVDIDYTATINRDGNYYLPKVGTIHLAGARYDRLHDSINTAMSRIFHDYQLTVSLGSLRSIEVFVVGEARMPGRYTVSSLSSLVNTIFAVGGPSVNGSMRDIQLKRDNEVITHFDLYDLLLKGDKSKDQRLLPGDVIYIPPAGNLVAISGSVKSPAIYETNSGLTLRDLVTMAGGFTPVAAGRKALIQRIDNRSVRKVDEFSLEAPGLSRELQDGDIVTIQPVSARFDNAVTLRGNVSLPGRYPWSSGMRVKDLVPDLSRLVTEKYWQQQNHISGAAQHGAEENAPELRTEVTRTAEVNWDYAVIERLNMEDLTTRLLPFNLKHALVEPDSEDNLLLKPGDVVTIFSKADMRVPVAKQSKYVTLEGEVKTPGIYKVDDNESLRDLVARVGGLTPHAYLFGAQFTSPAAQRDQQQRLEQATREMDRDVEFNANQHLNAIQQQGASKDFQDPVAAQVSTQRLLVEKLKEAKADGRIVLHIGPRQTEVADIPPLSLEDGDRFYVPARPTFVGVFGAVENGSSFIYRPHAKASDYLNEAGGGTRQADMKHTFVLRADGSVVNYKSHALEAKLMPGDTVIVPANLNKGSFTKDMKDWGQIIGQFGLGVAAINLFK